MRNIGYARCSTDKQDVEAQRQQLEALGCAPDRIYLDHGYTGTKLGRPALDQALAAVDAGDRLTVTKLDRFARSVPDARGLADQLVARGVTLCIGQQCYDPTDPFGKMFFNILATFAEFEVDLLKMRTREGMAIARQKGRLKGKPPKMTPQQVAHLVTLYNEGGHTVSELAALLSVSRPTIYRALDRAGVDYRGKASDPHKQ